MASTHRVVSPREYCSRGGDATFTLERNMVDIHGGLRAPCPGCDDAPIPVYRAGGRKGSGLWRFKQHHRRERIRMPTLDDVYRVVREHEPVTVEQVRQHLDVDWQSRQTVRNRLHELENTGRVIADGGRPVRFAINTLLEHEWRELPQRPTALVHADNWGRVMECAYCPARYRPETDDEPTGPCAGERD